MKKSYIIAFWTPVPSLHPQFYLDYFVPFFQQFGDIQCIDFQSHQDARTMHLLQQADLVVVGLPVISTYFYSFFCEQRFKFPRVCYAMLDYFPCLEKESLSLCQQYRIPEHSILHFPYNIQFLEAVRHGQTQHYLNTSHQLLQNEYKRIFLQELYLAGLRMLHMITDGSGCHSLVQYCC